MDVRFVYHGTNLSKIDDKAGYALQRGPIVTDKLLPWCIVGVQIQ